jgi:glycosyltransferase involved in cell wall biosynthesis
MPSVDVVIPVLNEERALPGCVATLRDFLDAELPDYVWRITIADNGSTDSTFQVAQELAKERPAQVRCLHLDQRGRGLALRHAWRESGYDIVSYMDVDLSTSLESFPPLVRAVAEEGYHVAIGSRLMPGALTTRSWKRERISRMYNLVIKAVFCTRFSDAQCGFKALSARAAQVLVPAVVNNHWFFDTELLILAEKRGFRIKEVPVQWAEDPDTRVKVVSTALEDLRGLARLRFGGLPRVQPPAD